MYPVHVRLKLYLFRSVHGKGCGEAVSYTHLLIDAIRTNAVTTYVPSIPVADIGIIGEVVQRAKVVSQGATQLLPDFDKMCIRDRVCGLLFAMETAKMVGNKLPDFTFYFTQIDVYKRQA